MMWIVYSNSLHGSSQRSEEFDHFNTAVFIGLWAMDRRIISHGRLSLRFIAVVTVKCPVQNRKAFVSSLHTRPIRVPLHQEKVILLTALIHVWCLILVLESLL
jgi:hypothetical protein